MFKKTIKLKEVFLFLLLSFMPIFSVNCFASNITSAQIIANTLKAAPNCLHLRVLGACFWMNGEGEVSATPYVKEYLPDVVISVFKAPNQNPWFEINDSIDKAGGVAESKMVSNLTGFEAGYGQHSLSNPMEQNVFFKETDVVGNPALPFIADKGGLLLPSTATPFIPYYQSMLDAPLWRGLPQTKMALIAEAAAMPADILHHIGTGLINWGGLYPIEGKVAESDDVKAAAVIALRAGYLITDPHSVFTTGHVYQGLSDTCGEHCHAAPIEENSDKTQFQLIYPQSDNACEIFGETAKYKNENENENKNKKGAHVWVVWRQYHGCKDGDGKFISKIIY